MANGTRRLMLLEEQEVVARIQLQTREVPVTHAGLCSSCMHTPDCTFLRFADWPIIHCDEWSGEISSWETLEAQGGFEPPPARVTPLRAAEPLAEGLCATCEEYPTCAFTKPEGGVWRCEEYR